MGHEKEDWKEELYGDQVREKLLEFAERGWDSIPEEEREKWFSRFKFWGVFHHRSGQESYFMLRLTNCGGVLEPGQLRAIGEVARDYASGPVENPAFGDAWIDLTTRQSIQLHWLTLEQIPEIFEKLEAVGVSPGDFGLPGEFHSAGTRRAITVSTELEHSREPLALAFALPRGSYATVVLREYLKASPDRL